MRTTISLIFGVIVVATRAMAVDVTSPGQTVVDGQVGVLTTDLVCSPPNAVYLGNAASLYLNGHVLDGCGVSATGFETDSRRIAVRGPGEIHHAGIRLNRGSLRVRDVAIHDAPGDGIVGGEGSIIRATDVTVTSSARNGIWATKVIARSVTVSGSGTAGFLGYGIVGQGGVDGHDVTSTDNLNDGVFTAAGKLTLRNSAVTGNAYDGVAGFAVKLVASTVTGNATDPDAEGDVVSALPPRIKNSTCGTSFDSNTQGSWGACAGD
jgi:hypothetical protein